MTNLKKLFNIIKKLNYILDYEQKRKAIFVLIIMVISSFMELLGVSSILPFVEAVTDPNSLREKEYVSIFINVFSIHSNVQLLIATGSVLIIIFLLKNIFMIYAYYVQYDYSSRVGKDLSVKMLNAYMRQPYEYFLNINSALVLRGCTSDTGSVYQILYNLIQLLTEVLSVCLIGAYLVYTDVIIACGTMALMLLVMGGIITVFKPVFKTIGNEYLDIAVRKNRAIYQITNGIKELFAMQRVDVFRNEYGEAAEVERKVLRKKETLTACPDRITEGICVSGIIGLIIVRLLFNDGTMISFIPKLAAFAMATFKIFPSIGKITNRLNQIVFLIPAMDNVFDVMHEADLLEMANVKETELPEGCEENLAFNNELLIKNVTWKYGESSLPVLKNINITVKKNELVGVIGPSGSGKTTLVDIVLGLLKPQEGGVYIDGNDISNKEKSWAKIIGYVPQTVFLIDDTIKNNVLFGANCEEDGLVWKALEDAQLKEYVESLPNGIDTMVGERGVKLSGGQRQRIAIARALYNKPQILVLDEATSALDTETEKAVMESVESLHGAITMIIVAHRLSTLRKCDKIYEIKNGNAYIKEKEDVLKNE